MKINLVFLTFLVIALTTFTKADIFSSSSFNIDQIKNSVKDSVNQVNEKFESGNYTKVGNSSGGFGGSTNSSNTNSNNTSNNSDLTTDNIIDQLNNAGLDTSDIEDTISVIDNSSQIFDSLGDFTLSLGGNTASNYLLGTALGSALVSLWDSDEVSMIAGKLDMCYKRTTSNQRDGDICQMLNNIDLGVDPCDALPNSLPGYTKKSTQDILSATIPLNEWCNDLKNETEDEVKEWATASKEATIAGKSVEELEENTFRTDSSKAKDEKKQNVNNLINNKQNNNTEKGTIASLSSRFANEKEMHKAQVVLEVLQESKGANISESDKASEIESPYKDVADYKKAIDSVANKESKIELVDLSHQTYITQAEGEFASLTQEYVTANDYDGLKEAKKVWIEQTIGDGEPGSGSYLELIYFWAEQKAEAEIRWELPQRIGNFSVDYSLEKFKYLDHYGEVMKQKILALHQLYYQQHLEKEIRIKWRRIAKQKADSLKIKLQKIAIAMQPFNSPKAIEEINAIIAAASQSIRSSSSNNDSISGDLSGSDSSEDSFIGGGAGSDLGGIGQDGQVIDGFESSDSNISGDEFRADPNTGVDSSYEGEIPEASLNVAD